RGRFRRLLRQPPARSRKTVNANERNACARLETIALESPFSSPPESSRTPCNGLVVRRSRQVQRLPFRASSVISPAFIARLIKGCRVDAVPISSISEIIQHFQRSNEHFSRFAPSRALSCCRPTGEPNAQAEDQIGR